MNLKKNLKNQEPNEEFENTDPTKNSEKDPRRIYY